MALNYIISPTCEQFHNSDKFVKMLTGPYGSGKSCACAVDVLWNACSQPVAPDGFRYSRVGVVRATYNELVNMTRKSLLEVLPPQCGTITGAVGTSPKGTYIIPLEDGTTVHLELNLFAMSNEADCHKVLSSNWTFAWINEATGVTAEVFNAVMNRCGRYPNEDNGGVLWGGIIMDFNQPEAGSWLDDFVKHPEPNWAVFRQPPAAFQKFDERDQPYYEVNAAAENLRNLGSVEEGDPEDFTAEQRGMRYYQNQINALLKSGREDIIMNQYCMMDVPIIAGKPVYSNFKQTAHVALQNIEPEMFSQILVGLDQSGHHPGAVILQNQMGRWCVLDEIYAINEGFENFLHGMLVPLLRTRYATNPVIAAIDPSNRRDDWQAITPKQRLADVGIPAVTEISNSPKVRIQMVERMLNLDVGGLLISPNCELLIRGFVHEYRYRRLHGGGSMGAAYTPQPDKTTDACHVHDALQYAALLIHMGTQTNDDMALVSQRLAEKRRVLSRIV